MDLSTAPDPLFFRPLAARFRGRGYDVWATARSYGETVAIAGAAGFDVEVVGEHGGRGTLPKAVAIARRARQLAGLAARRRPHVAVSFNSYAQAVAARMARVPFVTIADYEYQPANHLAFRLARTVLVPEGFEPEALRRQGAGSDRVVFFPGLKEHVALLGFTPDPGFPDVLASLGVPSTHAVATMRPPASSSLYHRFSNDWFYEVLAEVAARPAVTVVVLPRYPAQADRIRSLGMDSVVMPDRVLDGLNLVYWSDLVVGAGGSMNREAVVLGTPAYTVFAGRMAGVDERLLREGSLVRLQSRDDLRRLVAEKRRHRRSEPGDGSTADQIVEAVVAAVKSAGRSPSPKR